VFSADPWVLSNIQRPETISGTLSHMNIYPSVASILRRERDYSPGGYNSLFSEHPMPPQPLRFVCGDLWTGEAIEPPLESGKVKLRTEKYLY
jgi:hypothetical protein